MENSNNFGINYNAENDSVIKELKWLLSGRTFIGIDYIFVTEYETKGGFCISVFTLSGDYEALKQNYETSKKCIYTYSDEKSKKHYTESANTIGEFLNKYNFNGNNFETFVCHELSNEYFNFLQTWINQNSDSKEIKFTYHPINNKNSNKKHCYVATAVYGSYDCPQVWRFRRYRDETLSKNIFGRLFIKLYYAVSPTIIKYFGKTKWFNSFFRKHLDKFYLKLAEKGYDDTPYKDK